MALTSHFLLGVPVVSQAEQARQQQTSATPIQLDFMPPNRGSVSGNGTKNRTVTASRSSGVLQAILPWNKTEGSHQQPIYQGYTHTGHPAFWLSFDTDVESNLPVDIYFDLIDSETSGEVYAYRSQTSRVPGRGVFRFQLPPNAPALEPSSTYQWRFLAIRDGQILGESSGAIERLDLAPDLATAISDADLEKRLELHAELGVWHELIDDLARLRCENPSDPRFENAWLNLLRADGDRIGFLIRSEASATNLLSCESFKE